MFPNAERMVREVQNLMAENRDADKRNENAGSRLGRRQPSERPRTRDRALVFASEVA